MRVYVVSSYPAVRAGLTAVIRQQDGWQVVGDGGLRVITAPGSPRLPADEQQVPDVVLADLDGIDDAEVVESLMQALHPERGLVVLVPADIAPGRSLRAGDTTRLVTEMVRDAAAAGLAFSALRRDAPVEEIVAAMTAVGSGLVALDRRLVSDLLAARERVPAPAAEMTVASGEPLTAREIEVLQLMAQGLPNKIIALRLHISEHTAKFHVSSILMKLGAASRTEAVTVAARQGLLIL
ncbi:MAG TPA: response regulator transcription factor [Ktedonobacterales bacterium]|jgi:DNA-binding NarL/FixJ family response regulator|nr:response regulator transcription factor [Ktedonobacterales bacterium]